MLPRVHQCSRTSQLQYSCTGIAQDKRTISRAGCVVRKPKATVMAESSAVAEHWKCESFPFQRCPKSGAPREGSSGGTSTSSNRTVCVNAHRVEKALLEMRFHRAALKYVGNHSMSTHPRNRRKIREAGGLPGWRLRPNQLRDVAKDFGKFPKCSVSAGRPRTGMCLNSSEDSLP